MGNHRSLQRRPSLPRGQPRGHATNRRLHPQEHPADLQPTGVYVHRDSQIDTHRHGGNHKSLYKGNHWNPQSVHTSNRGVHSHISNHEAPPQVNRKDSQFRLDVHSGNQKGTQASKVHHHETDQESIHGGIHWNPQSSLYVHIGNRGAYHYKSDNHEPLRQGNNKDPQFRLDVYTGKQKNTQPSKVHHHESDQESIHWNPQSSLYVHRGNRGAHLYRSDHHEAPPWGNNKDPRSRIGNHKEIVAQQLPALAQWGKHEDRQLDLYPRKPRNIRLHGVAQQFAPSQGNKKDPQLRLDGHTDNQKGTQARNIHLRESDQESLYGGNHWDPQSSVYVHIGNRGAHLYRSDNHEAHPQCNNKDPRTGNHKERVAQQLAALALWGNHEDRQPGLYLPKANH